MPDIKEIVYERMMVLQDQAILAGKVTLKKEWCDHIGIIPTNLDQIKKGRQSFTLEQIHKAVNLVEASYDFVFGKINTLQQRVQQEAEIGGKTVRKKK